MIEEITWQGIDKVVNDLVGFLNDSEFDAVFGIANGGIIPAVLVANRLGIKYIETINKDDNILDIEKLMDRYETVLIVDDINDTGKTLDRFMHIDTVALYNCVTLFKRHSTKWPNVLCGHELDNDDWLHFPWEVLDK